MQETIGNLDPTVLDALEQFPPPVLAIDGPTGAGKGTHRHNVATTLGHHQLDSGCLYRAVALTAHARAIPHADISALIRISKELVLRVSGVCVYLNERDMTQEIRSEKIGNLAKEVSQIQEVREALRLFQLSMRKSPGLVADGRDMGELFADPNCYRFFLTCDQKVVAARRVKQLERLGQTADFDAVLEGVIARDLADRTRKVSPLVQHPKAIHIDTTYNTIEQTTKMILDHYYKAIAA